MKRLFAIMMVPCLLLAGCTASPEEEPDVTAPLAPSLTQQLKPSEQAAAVCDDFDCINAFSTALFSQVLAEGSPNPVISPASAYLCLAMVQNGADAETLRAFEQVLGADTDTLNTVCRAFVRTVSDTKGDTALSVANAVFADDDRAHLNAAFLQTLVDVFGAEAFSVDLPSDQAREAVNTWVNEKTHGMIPVLHEQNYPDDTVLSLINTLYFKALWETPFLPHLTQERPFFPAAGGEVSVPFLCAYGETLPAFFTDTAEGVVLPYDDGKTAFVAFMPQDGGDARTLASQMDGDTLSAYLAGAADTLVNLSLPKFTAAYGTNMNDALRNMGLTPVFDADQADLTRMGTGENGPLYLSWVIQKVKIIVDEEGTEAAAVTEAAAAEGAFLADSPRELTFDRPFVYAVVDLPTGTPLFIGLMDDPSQAAPAPAEQTAEQEPPTLDGTLFSMLTTLADEVFPGTAGSSLTAARYAATLLDYQAEAQLSPETVTATVRSFLVTLSEENAALFREQLQLVAETAHALLAGDAADLIASAGYTSTAYPWEPGMGKLFAAALQDGLD